MSAMSDVLIKMDMDSTCRTCLHRGGEMRSLYSMLRIADNKVTISNILETFFQNKVDENDGLPQNICLACTHLLSSVYTFNVVMQNSLMKLYQSNVETETFDDRSSQDVNSDYEEKPNIKTLKINKASDYNAPGEPTVLYCVECREEYNSTESLLLHCRKNHKPKLKSGRSCELCNEKLSDLKSLISHRKYHMFRHVCKVCWGGFATKQEIEEHKCGKVPKKVDKVYEKIESESEKKMCQCDQCGKSYSVGYIKLHMRIHRNETYYKCDYCPKKFKVRCSLNSHVLWNHKKTRNHKCDICSASFITASAKRSHYRKIHLLEKKHMCDSCGKKFFSKSETQRHMLTHSGEKNFLCHLCDKSYQTRYGLNVHLKSHSNV